MTARPGFSLIELLVALTLTAVIGAAMTGLFVTQARFLEQQQKQEFARGVTRSASNIIMSELRMLERDSAVVAASDTSLTVRVPYAMGVICSATATLVTFSLFPSDSLMFNTAAINGFAVRQTNGDYDYRATTTTPVKSSGTATCTGAGVLVVTPGGEQRTIVTASLVPATVGDPILLYQNVRYHFSSSTAVTGRKGLYRAVPAANLDEEIVAPFDTTARFNFFINDADTALATPPTDLSDITGIELIMNGISERPKADGTYTVVPLRTAVFFKNRSN